LTRHRKFNRGIDIDTGTATGEWMSLTFHKLVHKQNYLGMKWGKGGPWHYQWRYFFQLNPNATATQKFDFKTEMLEMIAVKRCDRKKSMFVIADSSAAYIIGA
jgi:hypothetical protein